jgi:hypothetical protein
MRQFLKAVLLSAVASVLPVVAASSDTPAPDNDPVRIQLAVCYRICHQEAENCLDKPEAKAPFCDTNEIECAATCWSCMGGFAKCLKEADKTGDACGDPAIACLQDRLAARKPDARPQIAFHGDGSAQATAVVIEGAQSEFEGIAAEGLWIARNHPDWRKSHQALVSSGDRHFDLIDYDAEDGHHSVWYDITGFFGKLK